MRFHAVNRLRLPVLLVAAWPLSLFAQDNAAQMLARMQVAVSGLNYQGTLVHISRGRAEQFRVFHRVTGQGATERIVLEDGAGAEIIRTNDEVICIFPDKKSVVIESRVGVSVKRSPFRSNLPAYSGQLGDYYILSVVGKDRIAKRPSAVIAIDSRDQYRYGYRMWLDQETSMPLKSQLIHDDVSMPLEEIRFTSISLPASLPADVVEPGIDTSAFSIIRHGKGPQYEQNDEQMIRWHAKDAPVGFMLTVSRFEYMEGSSEPRIHLVYTDGLASVSVFLDADAAESEQVEGLTTMGASNAYTLMNDGFLVTAMGEVPAETVRRIASSMSESD
jgi:sigma-E factor negative regulatory protein RseB